MAERSEVAPRHAAPGRPPVILGWWHRVLRTPLLTKLITLDVAINVVALVVMQRTPDAQAENVTVLSLVVVLVLNAALVAVALRPLRVLEFTARRVSRGEYDARTNMPWLADRNLVRIGDTFDDLLDRVQAERARVRTLAAQVVATGDRERARIARELHDGTAQSLSALDMLLASSLTGDVDPALRERLGVMREIVADALNEVRALSHAVHPRVLDDLGLAAAFEFLVRRARVQGDITLDCAVRGDVPKPVASVLYRVAQEAVHNALKHGEPSSIRVTLRVDADEAFLRVSDDGVGFDRAEIDAARRGMGLFVMEERVSLVDGALVIRSRPGEGTDVTATIPLPGEAS